MVVVYPEDVWYAGVQASDLEEILTSHIIGGAPVERLRYAPGVPGANKIDVEIKARPAEPATATPEPAWTRLCRTDEVPANGMKEFTAGGTCVLVAHTGDAYVAWQAMCPHEAIPLEQGIHDGCVLTCLEHMWQFDLKTGAPMGDAESALAGYPLKEDRGELYVRLGG
jgi:nitrite reductase/ring-hydroxylating ferredoxin subunit/(2Fe-2S) ferredoxin